MREHLFTVHFSRLMGAQDAWRQILPLRLTEGRIQLVSLRDLDSTGAELQFLLIREENPRKHEGISSTDFLKISTAADRFDGMIEEVIRVRKQAKQR